MRKLGLAAALAATVAVSGCATYPNQYGYDPYYGNNGYYSNGYQQGYYTTTARAGGSRPARSAAPLPAALPGP